MASNQTALKTAPKRPRDCDESQECPKTKKNVDLVVSFGVPSFGVPSSDDCDVSSGVPSFGVPSSDDCDVSSGVPSSDDCDVSFVPNELFDGSFGVPSSDDCDVSFGDSSSDCKVPFDCDIPKIPNGISYLCSQLDNLNLSDLNDWVSDEKPFDCDISSIL